ncbi:uncharacterized protein L3040_001236 [Drepanopeziza brunnea f. sp. 'multigermtubi']|uniref:uncharacterized protein n=1 Tax=Drepanopeziza brunnea f. sp. 'multigermtubi' TaxID=698441 RepID=UPI00238269DC|nr:hypothetical protein L3040_001236 [Drepanopeziza brunnea f. sp. 'multigermtubi']
MSRWGASSSQKPKPLSSKIPGQHSGAQKRTCHAMSTHPTVGLDGTRNAATTPEPSVYELSLGMGYCPRKRRPWWTDGFAGLGPILYLPADSERREWRGLLGQDRIKEKRYGS